MIVLCMCVQQKEKIVEKAKKTHKQRVEVSAPFSPLTTATYIQSVLQTGNEPIS